MWQKNFGLYVHKHGSVRVYGLVSHSPCSRIKLTISVWPCWAARCRALQPIESRTNRLTPLVQEPDTCKTQDRSWVRMSDDAWVFLIRKQTSYVSACALPCWVTTRNLFHFQFIKQGNVKILPPPRLLYQQPTGELEKGWDFFKTMSNNHA